MDGSKGLQDRYTYVWKENILERNVEMAEIQRIRRKAQGTGQKFSLGMHGYDPDNRDMHGIFYAAGPSFKKGFVQPTFENINIYELLAKVLQVKPAETDGDLKVVKGMLKGN